MAVKYLRLVTRESARKLGVEFEGPIFVSPDVETTTCGICGKRFTPLVYQVGYVVKPHHFHRGSGGIYCGEVPNLESLDRIDRNNLRYPWVGVLEPTGRIERSTLGLLKRMPLHIRVEEVYARQIRAFCTDNGHNEELTEGIVYCFIGEDPEILRPICCDKQTLVETDLECVPKFHFKITEEGEVLFSAVD